MEPGTFTMGSPESEAGRSTNETQHEVTLSNGFYLAKYEVTQAQYEAVITGNTDGLSATPSNWPNNPDRPVEQVSPNDIQKFLTRLNTQEAGNMPEGWAYVLPTEAQWEYACRAGTTTAYSWGDTITPDDANYNWDGAYNTGADFQQTHDVGQYSSNLWGFFDMHGNVWEWTADRYAPYSSGAQTDPEGPATGSTTVYREVLGAVPVQRCVRPTAIAATQVTAVNGSASVSVSNKYLRMWTAPKYKFSGVPTSRTCSIRLGLIQV